MRQRLMQLFVCHSIQFEEGRRQTNLGPEGRVNHGGKYICGCSAVNNGPPRVLWRQKVLFIHIEPFRTHSEAKDGYVVCPGCKKITR